MNKMIKMAVIAVGAATMLVGCGEQDPARKAAAALNQVRAELLRAGAAGFADEAIPEKIIAGLETGTLSDVDKKVAMELGEKASTSLSLFKKYMGALEEMKMLDSTIGREFFKPEQFLGSSPEEQEKLFDEAQKKLRQLRHLKASM